MGKNLETFDEFIKIPINVCKVIGDEPYLLVINNRVKYYVMRSIFILSVGYLMSLGAGEIVLFSQAIASGVLIEAITVVPFFGYIIVGVSKHLSMHFKKDRMTNLLEELRELFPQALERREPFLEYKRIMQRFMYLIAGLSLTFTTVFSLYPVFKELYLERYYDIIPKRRLGYLIWYPYDEKTNDIPFYLTFAGQIWGANTASIIFFVSDQFVCCAVALMCIHFDNISYKFENFKANGDGNDMKFLAKIIAYHAKVLRLNDDINSIFGLPILLNFLISSSMICFIGFIATLSPTEDIIKLVLFLGASMAQVATFCYYGNSLIESSLNVGEAAFYHNWIEADLDYKKGLIILIQRSNKAACIEPPTFPPVSFNTFMKVISMAYQFFALLRTSYHND